MLNWTKLQREAQPNDRLIFSIVGWHALTLPQDPQVLSASRRDMLAVLLAIGIDPKRSIVFHQDEVRVMLQDRGIRSVFLRSLESTSYGLGLDFKLFNSHGEAAADDDVEGKGLIF